MDWPSLRVWATPAGGSETIYYVPLLAHAQAIEGSYQCAYADFTLSGTVVAGDYVGLAFLTEHYTYQLLGADTLASALQAITDSVNAFSAVMKATLSGTTIRVYYTGGASIAASTAGANGNRFAVYSYSTGAATWDAGAKTFAHGTSPTKWRVTLDFSTLQGTITPDLAGALQAIPTSRIRKMRWTYAADVQAATFGRSEFRVVVSNWTVTGTNRTYAVAGPGSRRIEDHDASMVYSGAWTEGARQLFGWHDPQDYDSGRLAELHLPGDAGPHPLRGTALHRYRRRGFGYCRRAGGRVRERGDSGRRCAVPISGGDFAAGSHTVVATHAGASGSDVYFDFLELASPAANLPVVRGSTRHYAGDRLGHAALHLDRTGTDGVDAQVAGLHGAGESLRGRAVVL